MTAQEIAGIRGSRMNLRIRRQEHVELLGDLARQVERLHESLSKARVNAAQRPLGRPTPVRSDKQLRATLDRFEADERQELKQQIQHLQTVLEGKLRQ